MQATPSPDASVGIAMLLGFLCIGIVSLAIVIWVAIWIYRDAESRGQSGVLWCVLWLIFGLIPLIVWLIIRNNYPVGGGWGGGPYVRRM
ncbi:MAG: hypothetical protein ACE5O2_06145 [Armatimonadota bacterium]